MDTNFSVEVDGPVSALEIQPDGKILIGGVFSDVNGIGRTNLARLHSSGSLDESFEVSGEVLSADIQNIVFREGKIYVSVSDRQGTRRYNSNGVLELRYPAFDRVFAVDSKARLVWGAVTDGTYYFRIGRFTENGALDSRSTCRKWGAAVAKE